jgi:DNA-binding Lrp family transcriptional regulator
MPRKLPIDEVDKKIIGILSRDVRISNKDLAAEIGLSEGPTLRRTRKLFEKGVFFKEGLQIDYRKLGYKYLVIFVAKIILANERQFQLALEELTMIELFKLVPKNKTCTFVAHLAFETQSKLKSFEGSLYERFPYLVDHSLDVVEDQHYM